MAKTMGETERLERRLKRMVARGSVTRKRVDVQVELAWNIGLTQTRRAARLSKQALAMARKLGHERGIAYSLRNLGYCQLLFSALEDALSRCYAARDIFVKLEDKAGEASALDIIALVLWRLGSFDSALETAFTALSLHRKIGAQREQAWARYNIGTIYFELGDDTRCIRHLTAAQRLFKKIGYAVGQSRVHNGLGEVHERQGNLQKALRHFDRSLAISREHGIQLGVATALSALGTVHLRLNQMEQAEQYHALSLKAARNLGNPEISAMVLAGNAALLRQTGRADQACERLKRALGLVIKANAKPTILRIRRELADLYESLGDHRSALEHLKAYGALRQEVYSDQSKTKLRNLEISSNTAKAEKEAEILRLKNEELATTVRRLKSAQKKLIQTNKMASLGHLIAGFAAEMKEPLAILARYAGQMDREATAIAGKIRASGGAADRMAGSIAVITDNNRSIQASQERIASMVGSLTRFTQSEPMTPDRIDLHELLEATLNLIFPRKDHRIGLIREYGALPSIPGYYHLLSQVFMTVLINAREAIDKRGEIRVATAAEKRSVTVTISDSGRGIPPDKLAKIFEFGFSQKDTRIRMHMGLANSYNIIQKHRGEIEVDSTVGSGTVVRIMLPLRR